VWDGVVIALTAFDLFFIGRSFNPTIVPQDIFPRPDAIRFLEQDESLFRITGTNMILYPNTSMIFGLQDVRGYEAVVPRRYMALINRIPGHFQQRTSSLFVHPHSSLLDLLNVKYVLTEQDLGGRWELVHDDGSAVKVYCNRDVLPRAFVVYRAEVIADPERSLSRVTDHGFDFRNVVVLEKLPDGWQDLQAESQTASVIRTVRYSPNQIMLEAETDQKAILVLTDAYMPGWKARIDGQDAEIHVADHAFRALVVPAGTHQVEFVYRPLSFWGGAAISLLTAAIMVVALVVGVKRRRQAENGVR
jgi:uncharacterized membrane protein YfhO